MRHHVAAEQGLNAFSSALVRNMGELDARFGRELLDRQVWRGSGTRRAIGEFFRVRLREFHQILDVLNR